jgi:hypothetical protein
VTAAALLGLKLPFRFDTSLLKHDLALVGCDEWSPHYNERDFGGQWRGVALRSASGSSSDLIAAPPAANPVFHDTPLLARCEYFRETVALFQCPVKTVRLLALEPGSFIREHSDNALGFEDGEIRIHIPIETNPAVEFYVCGQRLLLEEGGCYYVNVNLPHRVNNRGSSARVHLVIDAEVNDWVRGIFREGRPVERSALPPGNLEEFRTLVLRDEALARMLRGIPDRRDFTERTIALGREHGFDFNEGDVDAGFRSLPSAIAQAPVGWTPVKVRFPEAEWIFTAGCRFTEPFFEDTLRVCLRNPFTALFRVAAPLPPANSAGHPTGFIFHMSRCGSTLVSQMLAALPATLVISEAPPIDDILQAALPGAGQVEALRSVAAALGLAGAGDETRYFIKFDAWHIHSLALIRAAFPGVPWIFVYRDPIEVLVSHLRIPGRQTIAGAMDPAILGMAVSDIGQLNRQQWCARVLGNFCRKALEFREDPNGLFIDYRQLPGAVAGSIARHFGLSLSPAEENLMREAARLDAKNPSLPFEPDTQKKQETGKALQSDPDAAVLNALYRELKTSASALRTTAGYSVPTENPAGA